MRNYFNKTLCLTLLTASFFSGGCTSLKKYDNPNLAAKPAVTQTRAQPTQTSNNLEFRMPINTRKSDLYFFQNISLDENVSRDYQELLSPKLNYSFKFGEQKETRAQARDELRQQFFRRVGLEGTIFTGDIFNTANTNLRFKPDINPLSDNQDFWIIYSITY